MESSWRFLTSSVDEVHAACACTTTRTFTRAGGAFLQAVELIEVGSARGVALIHEATQVLLLFIDLVGLGLSGAPVMKQHVLHPTPI